MQDGPVTPQPRALHVKGSKRHGVSVRPSVLKAQGHSALTCIVSSNRLILLVQGTQTRLSPQLPWGFTVCSQRELGGKSLLSEEREVPSINTSQGKWQSGKQLKDALAQCLQYTATLAGVSATV